MFLVIMLMPPAGRREVLVSYVDHLQEVRALAIEVLDKELVSAVKVVNLLDNALRGSPA